MAEALMLVQFLNALATAGANILPMLEKVSTLIQKRRTEGKTFTKEDLEALLDEGDALEAAARKQFQDTLSDPNTPH